MILNANLLFLFRIETNLDLARAGFLLAGHGKHSREVMEVKDYNTEMYLFKRRNTLNQCFQPKNILTDATILTDWKIKSQLLQKNNSHAKVCAVCGLFNVLAARHAPRRAVCSKYTTVYQYSHENRLMSCPSRTKERCPGFPRWHVY